MRRKQLALFITALVACAMLVPGVALAQVNNSARFMYRLYNPNSGEHFYTSSEGERAAVIQAGWQDEGIGWIAPAEGKPVYRLYNPNGGDHHYTASAGEKDNLLALGWSDEGIGWYSDTTDFFPIYRQYNPNATSGSHNYTASRQENELLVAAGWNGEGVGWYGLPLTAEGHVHVTPEADYDYRPFTSYGWTYDFGNLKSSKTIHIENAFMEHYGESACAIPITVTNCTGDTSSPLMYGIRVFGPAGVEVEALGYLFEDSLENIGPLPNGVYASAYLYFQNAGSGDYTIQFEDYSYPNRYNFKTMIHDVKVTITNK